MLRVKLGLSIFGSCLLIVVSTAFAALSFIEKNPYRASVGLGRAFERPDMSYTNCTGILREIVSALNNLDPAKLRPFLNYASSDEDRNPRIWVPRASNRLGLVRVDLRERLRQYSNQGDLDPQDVDLFRAGLRTLRTFDEEATYFVQVILPGRTEKKSSPAGKRNEQNAALASWPNIFINPKFESEFRYLPNGIDIEGGLKSGDVLVVRGSSEVSSMIARIPGGHSGESQASHLLVIYRDEQTGELYALESLIQDGMKIRKFSFANEARTRCSIYRFRDSQIAAAGAKALYERLRQMEAEGTHPDYNFSMLSVDPTKPIEHAYCSQSAAFCMWFGSGGKIQLPSFPTHVEMKDPWMLKNLTIQNRSEIFAPGDAEIEKHLEFVLEIRDPLMTHDALLADAIITVLTRSMNAGSRIRSDWKSHLARYVLLPVRKAIDRWPAAMPLVSKLKAGVPFNIQPIEMEFIVSLRNVFGRAHQELRKRDDAYIQSNGYAMNWIQLLNETGKILNEDQSLRYWFYRPPH